MGRDRKNEQREEQFTKWVRGHRALPAWKALGFPARDAYFHLQVRCFADTAQKNPKVHNNNGEVFRSPRKLAEDMGCNPKTAMAALADLQAKGWIICTHLGRLGTDGRGETAQFRLTMLPTGQGTSLTPATKEPMNWAEASDYPVVVFEAHKPKGRKGMVKNLEKRNPAPECGAALHQNAVQQAGPTEVSAPECGAGTSIFRPRPAPQTGAYLIAISSDKMRANLRKGNGLCGRAVREAAGWPEKRFEYRSKPRQHLCERNSHTV